MASESTPFAASATPPNAAFETPTDQAPGSVSGDTTYPPYPPYPPYPSYAAYAPSPEVSYGPYPYPAPGYFPWMFAPPQPRMGTWALVSMICGAVSIASFQTILAILAIIFGFIGLNEIKKSAGQVEGRGFAIAGLVMGSISLAIGLLIVVLYILYFVFLLSMVNTLPD